MSKKVIIIWSIVTVIVALIASLFLFASDPVVLTEEQKNYIWEWTSDNMNLTISEGAFVDYEKTSADWDAVKSSVSVNWPIIEFSEKAFTVWILFIKTDFVIDEAPYKDWSSWKMKIDWNELSKKINWSLVVPEVKEIDKLTLDFFELLAVWAEEEDYGKMYSSISKLWEAQIKVEDLNDILKWFIWKHEAIRVSMKSDLVYYVEPEIAKTWDFEILSYKWYFNDDAKVYFELNYVYEYPNWKLVWLNISPDKID